MITDWAAQIKGFAANGPNWAVNGFRTGPDSIAKIPFATARGQSQT
jgi:hypothetical protein